MMALGGGGLDYSMFSSALSCGSSNHGPYHRHCNCSLHVLSSFQRSRRRGRRGTQLRIPGKASKPLGSDECLSITATAATSSTAKHSVLGARSRCEGHTSSLRDAIKTAYEEMCNCQLEQPAALTLKNSGGALQAGEEQIFDCLSYLSEMCSVLVVAADHHQRQS